MPYPQRDSNAVDSRRVLLAERGSRASVGARKASTDAQVLTRQHFLSTLLARKLAHNALAALALATVLFGGLAMNEQQRPVRDLTPTLAEKLVATGDCWTVTAPEDVKRPGHAVISDAQGHATYSAANVGPALAHVFEGKHPAITVHGFCR